MSKKLLISAFVAAVAAPSALLAQTPEPMPPTQPPVEDTTRTAGGDVEAAGNLVSVAKAAGNFSVLLKAVEAAGLTETLSGEGPFTIFAPTDEAFAKVPQAQLDSLLGDPDALRVLLLGHVLPSKVSSADAAGTPSATTAAGSSVQIASSASGVKVGNASVVTADIAASNGVIHAVDAVILPGAPAAASPAPPALPAEPTVPPTEPTTPPSPTTPSVPPTEPAPTSPSIPPAEPTPASPTVPPTR